MNFFSQYPEITGWIIYGLLTVIVYFILRHFAKVDKIEETMNKTAIDKLRKDTDKKFDDFTIAHNDDIKLLREDIEITKKYVDSAVKDMQSNYRQQFKEVRSDISDVKDYINKTNINIEKMHGELGTQLASMEATCKASQCKINK